MRANGVGPDLAYSERELLHDVFCEVDGTCLRVSFVNLEGADACCIVYCCELEAVSFLAAFSSESRELDSHLDVMPRYLLVVSLGVNLALARTAWEAVQTVPAKNAIDASIGDPDVVIALQIPDDPDRSEMILATKE